MRDWFPKGSRRAREIRSRGRERKLLADFFELRIEEALREEANVHLFVPPWDAIEGHSDFFERFKCQRIIEASRVLSPWHRVNAALGYDKTLRKPIGDYVAPQRPKPPGDWALIHPILEEVDPNRPMKHAREAWQVLIERAPLGLSEVLQAVAVFKGRWRRSSDAFSTNTLACLTVIGFVDAAVFAIAQAINPLTEPNWDEPLPVEGPP